MRRRTLPVVLYVLLVGRRKAAYRLKAREGLRDNATAFRRLVLYLILLEGLRLCAPRMTR